jgi:hypothetical protein
MVIDPAITVGNILTIVSLIAAFVVFLTRFRTDIQVMVTRIAQIDKELVAMREEIRQITMTTDRIGTVLIEMATQRVRLDGLEKRADEGQAARNKLLADFDIRFAGLEERLRAVETLAHVEGPKDVSRKRKAS